MQPAAAMTALCAYEVFIAARAASCKRSAHHSSCNNSPLDCLPEPAGSSPGVTGRYSNQLNYRSIYGGKTICQNEKAWHYNAKPFGFGVPTGIRTPVIAVKGRCPRPLDDGDEALTVSLLLCTATSFKLFVCYRKRLGGGKRDRTADLLHAMQALSQLSYTPKRRSGII